MSNRTERQHATVGIGTIENAVMDMWDAGASGQRILRELPGQLGVKKSTIMSVLGYMRETRSDRMLDARTVSAQSAAFTAALRRHHPERYGA